MLKQVVFSALLLFLYAGAWATELDAANAEADKVHSNGKTALMVAAKQGDIERMKQLLGQGAGANRPNNNGGTPIMYAALSGDPDTVRLLLEHGARVNAVATNGWTALMIASVKGFVDVARLLLEYGAEPNQTDVYSWTPLMRAVYQQRPQVARLLAEHEQTRVNHRGENGVTALHLAVARGDAKAVELLLANGADPAIRDASGRTALDFARKNNDLSLLRLMKAGHAQ